VSAATNPLPALTLPQMLREQARTRPGELALRQKDFGIWLPYTWAEYYRQAARFGMGLLSLGTEPGTKVGILSENRAEWVIAQMGAGMVGCTTVGVYPTSPTPEVAYVVGHADVEVMVCEDQEQADKILDAIEQLPRIRKVVVVDMRGLRGYDTPLVQSFEAFADQGDAHARAHPGAAEEILDRQRLEDEALIIYTSGSTGKPKGAILTYGNLRAGAWSVIDRLGLDRDASALSYLPLCHVAEQGMTNFGPVYLGCTVSFGESIRTVQRDLRETAPSYFLGVPRIWEKLHSEIHIKIHEAGGVRRRLYEWALKACAPIREKPPADRHLGERLTLAAAYWLVFRALQNFLGLREAKIALTGAAPIAPEIFQYFRTLGVPLAEVYGATELSCLVTCHRLDDIVPGTVGTPCQATRVRLSEAGEILVAGEQVFKGYYKNPGATEAAIVDGWYHTGDVAQWVGDNLKIVDRLKDIMITAGGKNLSPSEIENTVKASPYVKECIVVGDQRKFVSALIQIEFETVAAWAEERRLAFTTFRSLAEHPEVRTLVEGEVARANANLAPVGNVRKFHLLTKELDHDDDEVTATMKIRRSKIYEKYAAEIEAMY
jgi:long-chain acyl-CoA synthetase